MNSGRRNDSFLRPGWSTKNRRGSTNRVKKPVYHGPTNTTIFMKLDDAQKLRSDAHGWQKKLLELAEQRIKDREEQIRKMDGTRGRTGRVKRIEVDPAEREQIVRLQKYWAIGRDRLSDLSPADSLVEALTVLVLGHLLNGLDQTDKVASQQARLNTLKKEFDRLYHRLDKMENAIFDIEKEISDSGDKNIERFKTGLKYIKIFRKIGEEDSDP